MVSVANKLGLMVHSLPFAVVFPFRSVCCSVFLSWFNPLVLATPAPSLYFSGCNISLMLPCPPFLFCSFLSLLPENFFHNDPNPKYDAAAPMAPFTAAPAHSPTWVINRPVNAWAKLDNMVWLANDPLTSNSQRKNISPLWNLYNIPLTLLAVLIL